MSIEQLGSIIESFEVPFNISKIRLSEGSSICLEKRVSGSYVVFFGCEQIFSSGDEGEAWRFYKKIKSIVEKGNYEIYIYPSLRMEIKPVKE